MATYAENAYNWLKRIGYARKYECPGVYCIKIDDEIVYIGKSYNMLKRVAQHYTSIRIGKEKKYRLLSEAVRKGHSITFDVLYYSKLKGYYSCQPEIGAKEGELIRQYKPILNTQIPKAEDWNKYDTQEVDAKDVLDTILGEEGREA